MEERGRYLTAKELVQEFPHLSVARLSTIMCRPELASYRNWGRPMAILYNAQVKELITEINEIFKIACHVRKNGSIKKKS